MAGKGKKLSRRAFLRRFAGEGLVQDLSGVAPEAGRDAQAAAEARLEELRGMGVAVTLISGDSNKLQVRAKDAGRAFGDDRMRLFEPLVDRIVWLDLGSTGVGDEGLAVVARMKNLRRLHLQNTRVTDEGLAHLSRLGALNYLNLYGTEVSDAGLRHLQGLEALRALFLWQTRATPAGVAALVEALPELEADLGAV